ELDVIDDEHVVRAWRRIQLEPQLLLQRSENRRRRRPIDLVREYGRRWRRPELCAHAELDVEIAGESGPIDHGAAHWSRQEFRERIERDPSEAHGASRPWTGGPAR